MNTMNHLNSLEPILHIEPPKPGTSRDLTPYDAGKALIYGQLFGFVLALIYVAVFKPFPQDLTSDFASLLKAVIVFEALGVLALAHGGGLLIAARPSLATIPVALVMGIAGACLTIQCNSVLPSMALHACVNMLSWLAFPSVGGLAARSGSDVTSALAIFTLLSLMAAKPRPRLGSKW